MRRQRILGFTAVTAFALLIGHGIAGAQAQGGAAAPAPAVGGITQQVSLSPKEMLTQSESMLTRMDASRVGVRRMLESARAQRDVVKTLCLNDKLNQIDVAVRSARERKQSLEAAAQRADNDLASHEFTILSVLRQRSDQLTAEAQQCIGKELEVVGDSVVSATVDPGLPDPPGWQAPGDNVIVEPPTCSSCIK